MSFRLGRMEAGSATDVLPVTFSEATTPKVLANSQNPQDLGMTFLLINGADLGSSVISAPAPPRTEHYGAPCLFQNNRVCTKGDEG